MTDFNLDIDINTSKNEIDVDISQNTSNIDLNVVTDDLFCDVVIDVNSFIIDLKIEPSIYAVINGGLKRQLIEKISSNDNDYIWKFTYYDFLINCQYNGNETQIDSGNILQAEIDDILIYRFISNNTNSKGYPFEDSFYYDFDEDNEVLSNLIVSRG